MERKIEFDQLKGLGIVFMIIGHCALPYMLAKPFCVFHMPLFFIVSGCLYKERSLADVFKRNARKVLLPYLFTCVILYLVFCVYYNRYDWWIAIIFGNAYNTLWFDKFYTVGPLWFLPSFFISLILYNMVSKINRVYWQILVLVSAFILSLVVRKHFNLLPFGILQGIVGSVFILFGNIFYKNFYYLKNKYVVSFGVISYIICLIWGELAMSWHIYKLNILQIAAAVFATFLLLYIIRKYFKKCCFIAKVGYYSLPIMCIHSIDRRLNFTYNIIQKCGGDSRLLNLGGNFFLKFCLL